MSISDDSPLPPLTDVVSLPLSPDLDRLKNDAKHRLKQLRREQPEAKLADAQFATARAYGFSSWRALKAHVDDLNEEAARHEALAKADRQAESTPADPKPTQSKVTPRDPTPLSEDIQEAWKQAFSPLGKYDEVVGLVSRYPSLVETHPWPGYDFTPLQATAGRCVQHRPDEMRIAAFLIAQGASYDLPTVARCGALDRVRDMLQDRPTLINQPDPKGRTALYRAVCVYGEFRDGEAVARLLFDRGAQADIYVAAALGLVERVEALLAESPALAQARDPEGCTALHWAVRPRKRWLHEHDQPRDDVMRITRRLLESGADPLAANQQEQQMHAMHHVAEWPGYPGQADMLIQHGADLNATAGNGWTPLDYALDRDRQDIAAYLQSRGARRSDELR